MMIIPNCFRCKHADRKTLGRDPSTCAAFPDGIPAAILYDGDPHTTPFAGDHGIRFTPDDRPPEAVPSPSDEPDPIFG